MHFVRILPGPIANNRLEIIDSRDEHLIIDFVSNSSQSGVGIITLDHSLIIHEAEALILSPTLGSQNC